MFWYLLYQLTMTPFEYNAMDYYSNRLLKLQHLWVQEAHGSVKRASNTQSVVGDPARPEHCVHIWWSEGCCNNLSWKVLNHFRLVMRLWHRKTRWWRREQQSKTWLTYMGLKPAEAQAAGGCRLLENSLLITIVDDPETLLARVVYFSYNLVLTSDVCDNSPNRAEKVVSVNRRVKCLWLYQFVKWKAFLSWLE